MRAGRKRSWFVALALVAACGSDPGVAPDAGGGGDARIDGSGGPAAPGGVAASDGTSADAVTVTWEAVAGAAGYRVWRDGVAIAEVSGTTYDDGGAGAGGVAAAPGGVTASTDLDDRVRVTWSAAVAPAGAVHAYAVTALDGGGESAPSATDDGHRGAAPVTGYELAIDGGAFVAVGDVTSHDDLAAPAAVVVGGAAAASQGTHLVSVDLSLTGAAVAPAPRTYVVRALSAAGTGADSAPASGARAIANLPPLAYQWERSAADADAAYSDLPGAAAAAASDNGLAPGAARWYRCRVAVAGVVATSSPARGWVAAAPDVPRPDTWISNGRVEAIARAGGAILLGGRFTYVGPPTGPGALVSAATGAVDLAGARFGDGTIYAAIPDGDGGWYVGGTFATVDGVARKSLAHLLADGSLDPAFDARVHVGHVYTMALSGDTLYLGGGFTRIVDDNTVRNRLAAVDRVTGALRPWAPSANGNVNALVVSGGTVYVGGDFSAIDFHPTSQLTRLDAVTGAWIVGYGASGTVEALALDGTTLYAAGRFTSAGGQPRALVAALDTTANLLATAWNPQITGDSVNGTEVRAIAVGNGRVHLGGAFTTVGGQPRRMLAAVDAVTAAVTPWDPRPLGDRVTWIRGLALAGDTVYVAGNFNEIGGARRNHVAAVDAATGTATSWNPNAGGDADMVAVQGDDVYVGGGFTSIGGIDRRGLAALDDASGVATAWDPAGAGDVHVGDLAVSGGVVYVAGRFTQLGGQPRNNLAALDLATGAATPWNPDADAWVETLALAGGTVYAGGSFTRIGAQARRNLAAIAAATGAATAWAPEPDQWIESLLVDGGRLYVTGSFTAIAGSARGRAAAFDLATGDLAAWNPDAGGGVYAITVAGDTVYLGGVFTTIGGQPRDCIGAVDAVTGTPTSWNPTADPATRCDAIRAMAVSGSTIFIGGSLLNIGSTVRWQLANVDRVTGAVTAWNPAAEWGSVEEMLLEGGRLFVVGEFRTIGRRAREGLAVFEP